MGDVRRDHPHVTGFPHSRLVADPERDVPAEHDPDLLVGMTMLRHGDAGIELENAQRDSLAVDGPHAQTVEERQRLDVGDRGELMRGSFRFSHGAATIRDHPSGISTLTTEGPMPERVTTRVATTSVVL